MSPETRPRVSSPPTKPLLIWDGECHFCRKWIERWRATTGGKVDYATAQEVGARFPEIPADQFGRSVVLVEPDGQWFGGAEAVFRSLGGWQAWLYDHVPGFAPLTEAAYASISRQRRAASIITRLFWGNDVRPPTYFWARRWFLRGLAVVYLIAFVSFWVQADGLVGARGILPIKELLEEVRSQVSLVQAVPLLPTLCWISSSDAFLHFLCGAGVVLSVILLLDFLPALCLVLLFVLYLSITVAGQTFLSFQWDILLLETGFMAIFLAPWRWRTGAAPVSRTGLFWLKLLLFKLMLMSGIVKLTSGDDSWGWVGGAWHWASATALDYHYWSQPLPTVFAWWADQHAEWFKHFSVGLCLFIEIIVPFFMWAPRRLRLSAFCFLVFLQLAIALTGNYCFFNLLTVILCLLLLDDVILRRAEQASIAKPVGLTGAITTLRRTAVTLFLVVSLPINAQHIYSAFRPDADFPRLLDLLYQGVRPFRIVNEYGLFRVMTKDRREIVLEGSADGISWQPYEFKWKPGDVNRAPGWCAPHQPRLDWQMWFAALSPPRQNPWLIRLAVCLLEGKKEPAKLLKKNPFPDEPPRYVRGVFYRYRFTTGEEKRETGAWWKRQELGEYLPTISLK